MGFAKRLAERQTDASRRRWLFVPCDQLSDALWPLSCEDPRELQVLESRSYETRFQSWSAEPEGLPPGSALSPQ